MEKEIKELPDVDLNPIMGELEKEVQVEPQKLTDQFKSEEDRIKGYKELQGFATKVSQENKTLKEQLTQINEQMELAKLSSYSQPPPQYQPQDPNYEEPIESKIQKAVTIQGIAEILETEAMKNRGEFQERYAYAQIVSRQYPQLATSKMGVVKLFELGDKLRNENMKRNAGKALESIFGEPLGEEEINKLRTLVKGDKAIMQKNLNTNAYMPETSTSTRSGADQNQNTTYDSRIEESARKGDVDGVIKNLFDKIVAE